MSIFHTEEFAALHGMRRYERDGVVLPVGEGRSPKVGTFGGFSAAPSLDAMEQVLADAMPVEIVLAPASHDQSLFTASVNVMIRAGYRVAYADINCDMAINTDLLTQRMEDGNRKKYAKCERAGLLACELPPDGWRDAWELLHANRLRNGHRLSMDFGAITLQEEAVGGTRVFGTFAGEEMLAAAICFQLSEKVFYVYAWGDTGKSELAPTVHLAAEIYETAKREGFGILDAGISSYKGEPNRGLLRFKHSLGFGPSLKLTMTR